MNIYLTKDDWNSKEKEPYMEIAFRQEKIANGYNIIERNIP